MEENPKKVIPNPNGANGSVSDPREQMCWDLYVANNLENAYQAAIKAGYGKANAKHITTRDWFIERLAKLKRKEMLSKAERNLGKALDVSYESEEGKIVSDVMRIVVDVSKHVTETLGKNDGYSKRNELTGKDGEKIELPIYAGLSRSNEHAELHGHTSNEENLPAQETN